ncbi:MAG: FtsW/RodA/SpoVE family cell cycle protein [Acidobacteriaceae bacterium]|nr:FtsW/RodA/SpoVE family cell cycle protein [Acidobacteriaceae bacterium]MBV9782170.1 FtsW/RodA/SpoVE family cell cycle protein [Acidobacteriaceae bacterium]
MKVSRAEIVNRVEERRIAERTAWARSRTAELLWMLAASTVTAAGLALMYLAKTHDIAEVENKTLNLNRLGAPEQLTPYLRMIAAPADQEFAANHIYNLKRHGEEFGNVGAIARIRVTETEIAGTRGLSSFPKRMAEAKARRKEREERTELRRGWLARRLAQSRGREEEHEFSIPLLTSTEFAQLKPDLRVRDARDYRKQFVLWTALFFVAFYTIHAAWRLRGFQGDRLLLPILHALTGIGLILMISLRDPLRDTLLFAEFIPGVIVGCAAMFMFSIPNYERHFRKLSFLPLIAALILAAALGMFGSGPGTSDAKVNLFFFQPMEVIRILIVFFLAGYFAQNWDALRHLRQHGKLASLAARFNMPRLDYVLPVAAGVLASIALFFWLSDLGPALVIGCLFLSMYSIARKRILLSFAGLAAIVLAFFVGYTTGYPHTVRERVDMWKSPWDNHVHGGDQLADSLWSLASGGGTGTGVGLGDPQSMPAAHTDLVITAWGEEAGLIGIAALYLLYGVLIYRCFRIAMRASGTYSFFLVLGLSLITALQLLLITGGLLGLIPLSGVVSPFLSYGRTSMVANFVLFAIILSISSRSGSGAHQSNFGSGMRVLTGVLAVLVAGVLARFFWLQVARADDVLVRPSLVMQADGVRRYQYNPRLLEAAREIPKGTIFDRNGIPLATSDWAQLKAHRTDYEKLGVALDKATSKLDERQYPLGAPMFYMLGDVRTRLKQGARNTAFEEDAARIRLQGYDDVAELEQSRDPESGEATLRIKRDYRALIPLVRHRYDPNNPSVREILARPRDVHMSIDAALEMRAAGILSKHLATLGKQKGALVVMDPSTGDLLASVSYPWPSEAQFASVKMSDQTASIPGTDLLDRARFGLYPPGSSFKILTTIAALRKDPGLAKQRYSCVRLPDGRVGNFVGRRAIRDDIKDKYPHGSVDIQKGIIVSCNAFFAQLGAYSVGAQALFDTANRLGISVAQPNTVAKLKQNLAQASYGQGQVVVSPFQMARVAATIANGGNAPEGRWVIDETNARVRPPEPLLSPELANQIAGYMRGVVMSGTARVLSASAVPIAGKTGTAELVKAPSHAWFIGFAPYGAQAEKQIAFAVLVENGEYGATAAAPIAGEIVAAARELGII